MIFSKIKSIFCLINQEVMHKHAEEAQMGILVWGGFSSDEIMGDSDDFEMNSLENDDLTGYS